MARAVLSFGFDDGDIRVGLQRLREDVERTAQFISSKNLGLSGGVSGTAAQGRAANEELARALGVSPAAALAGVRNANVLLDANGQAVRFGGGSPGGGGGGAFGHEAHAVGLQSVAHSARAVADTYAYRVSPAIAEVHRAAAGFLAFSVPGFGALAAVGLSAATIIGVELFGSLLKANEAAKEGNLAFKAALAGDPGPSTEILKKKQAEIIKTSDEISDLQHKIDLGNVRLERAQNLPANVRGDVSTALGLTGLIRGTEQGKLKKDLQAAEDARLRQEEALEPLARKALAAHVEKENLKESLEDARANLGVAQAGSKFALEAADTRIKAQAKLADGERKLNLDRIKGEQDFAEAEFQAGRRSLDELQGGRRAAIFRRRDTELAGADAEADSKRAEVAIKQAQLLNDAEQRRAFLSQLTDPRQKREEEIKIAQARAEAVVLTEKLADIEADRLQKRRGISQQANLDLGKDDQRRFQEAAKHEDAVFALRKSRGDTTLQDEATRIQRRIDRTADGSEEHLRLEKELQDKKNEIRDRGESGAIGIIGEAGALLKSRGVTEVSAEQLGQTFDEINQENQRTLTSFAAGGAVSPEALTKALRSKSQLRELEQLGFKPGQGGEFLSTAAGDPEQEAIDQWFRQRYGHLYKPGELPGGAPSLNFGGGAQQSEADIRRQLGLPATPEINADLVVQGFDGAWSKVKQGAVSMVTELDGIFAARAEGWATSIEERVLSRLREILYRDFQRQ